MLSWKQLKCEMLYSKRILKKQTPLSLTLMRCLSWCGYKFSRGDGWRNYLCASRDCQYILRWSLIEIWVQPCETGCHTEFAWIQMTGLSLSPCSWCTDTHIGSVISYVRRWHSKQICMEVARSPRINNEQRRLRWRGVAISKIGRAIGINYWTLVVRQREPV
jgi:hypothetical protein